MSASMQIQQLTIRLPNKTVCHQLSLELKPGQTWGILGPNGCGKTTLLHSLARLRPIDSGRIFLNKQAIQTLKTKRFAQQVGILLQKTPAFFNQTVEEICATGFYPRQGLGFTCSIDIKGLIAKQLVQLELVEKRLQTAVTLSGGEQQRLAVATLLCQAPSIYLLDEPTNHLDTRYQIVVLDIFKQLVISQSAAVVMALHDINLAAQYCDNLILLFNDECLVGPKSELLTQPILEKLYQTRLHSVTHAGQRFWLPNFTKPAVSSANQ